MRETHSPALDAKARTAGVSAILPTYNSLNFVHRAIDSVLGQQGDHLQELIVVDDGSTDGTADFIWHRYGADPRVKLFANPANLGPAHARNKALRAATGEWVALIDADDAWLPGRLECLLGPRAGDADVVFDNLVGYDQSRHCPTGLMFEALPRNLAIPDLLAEPRSGGKFDLGYLKPVIRRAFLAQAGLCFPDLRVNEDLVFFTELLIHRPRIRTVDTGYYVYTTPVGQHSGRLSAYSRTQADDLPAARLLGELACRYADRLGQAEIAAIKARALRMAQNASIARFHRAFVRRRYLACLMLVVSDARVRAHVLAKLRARLAGRARARRRRTLALNRPRR